MRQPCWPAARVGAFVLLAGALTGSAAPAGAARSDDPPLRVLFSDRPKEGKESKNFSTDLGLRPNTPQAFYLYVENTTKGDIAKAVVEVWHDGDAPPGGSPERERKVHKELELVKAGDIQRVTFGVAPRGKPPELTSLSGQIEVRVRSAKGDVLDKAEVRVSRPAEYVDVPRIRYVPGEKKLEVRVQAGKAFSGPPCPVSLDLRPERIPGMVPGRKKEGTYDGVLNRRGDELLLEARGLAFEGDAAHGLVYLKIDNYERAYTYYATFGGSDESVPRRVTVPVLRLDAARYAAPSPKYPVRLEVDTAEAGLVAELGFDRNADGQFEEGQGELQRFVGDRRQRVLFNAAGPFGELLFRTEVQDWQADLDTTGTYKRRDLRLRLLRTLKKGEAGKEGDEELPDGSKVRVEPATDSGAPVEVDEKGDPVRTRAVTHTVVLDVDPPEGVEFLAFPRKLNRGAALPVSARGADPESGIEKVVFFVGKPAKGGGPASDAPRAEGERDGKGKAWSALLPAATDQKGKFELSVQFTNGAKLTTTKTVVIQLVDPPPAAAPAPARKTSALRGTVRQGTRPQPKLTVVLSDAAGAAVDTAVTDALGRYVFENVPPGNYRVSVTKGDKTSGQTAALVVEGKDKDKVDVQLTR